MLSFFRHIGQSLYFSRHKSGFFSHEKDHFFLWIPVLLGIGIAFYFGITSEIPVWVGLTCLFISGLTTYYLRHYYIIFLSTLSLTIIFVGFFSAQFRTLYLDTKVLPYSFGPAGIQGRIVETIPDEGSVKLVIDNLQISRLPAPHIPTRLRLHVSNNKTQFKTGQWVNAYGEIKPPPPPTSPGAFDFQRHTYFLQIGAIGFAYGDVKIIQDNTNSFSDVFGQWRQSIRTRLENHFNRPEDKDKLSLAVTFLTGSKGQIDEETMETVRKAGLAHLLAISGLHIGLVCAFFFFGTRLLFSLIPPLALNYPIKKWAAVIALGASLFFTLLTGASIPTTRAFLMTAIVLVGVLADRKAISLRTVAWAAIFILLFFPESLLSASFHLSFAAVTALIAFYEQHKSSPRTPRLMRYVSGVLTSSLIASTATMPFAAYHFNRVALWGIGANLLAIPLTALIIMPAGLCALALMPIGLDGPALSIMGWGLSALLWVSHQTATLPASQLSIAAFPTSALILITTGGLMLCLLKSRLRYASFAAFALALGISLFDKQPDILISADGRLSALQSKHGEIIISQMRRASYTRKKWIERWGQENAQNTPVLFDKHLECDTQGCLFRHDNGLQIIFNEHAMALPEDCQKADILIVPQTSPSICTGPDLIIDRNSLNNDGAHALYFDDNGLVDIKSVRSQRGQRPWTVY